MDLHFEGVDFCSEVADGFLVDVHLDSEVISLLLVLILSSFLFVEEQGVFGLDVGDLVIEPQEVMLKVFEFEELFFEGGDGCILVCGLGVIEKSSGGEVAVHVLLLFLLEINIQISIPWL